MLRPIKLAEVEFSQPLPTIEGLDGYATLKALVRLHGTPIGFVKLPVDAGKCTGPALRKSILHDLSWGILQHHLADLLAGPRPNGLQLDDLNNAPHIEYHGDLPMVTVAVCTRDRAADLARCLEALSLIDYPSFEVLVVDNAPSSDATEHLVREKYPDVRYIREERPGLDWARNRAIAEAQGDIIAYTDDDVVVDPGWVSALAKVFAENADVMAVTGLVVAYELDTPAQILFEMYGGFGRSFQRRWYQAPRGTWDRSLIYQGAGQFGTGANMAYRLSVFDEIGCFDPALDVGTVTNGGGDLEMFFRVLKHGHTLVYEPAAFVRHRHRREYEQLRTQLFNNGIGLYSYFVRSARAYEDERWPFMRLAIWWLLFWHLKRLASSIVKPTRFPRGLILAELWGSILGPARYRKAALTAHEGGEVRSIDIPNGSTGAAKGRKWGTAIRTVDLDVPLGAITDVADYGHTRVFVLRDGRPIGSVDINNVHKPISVARLRDAIVKHLTWAIIKDGGTISNAPGWQGAFFKQSAPLDEPAKPKNHEMLPAYVPVSIVIGTHDRPEDLRNCLQSLTSQISLRRVEIVVVDNNPASGVTPGVVAQFPGVRLVSEARKGVAYARNAGITATTGDIVVTVDDDVTVPPGWLEQLVAPFSKGDVMAVTGNIWPLEMETRSQQLFEEYGGLGRGFDTFEINGDWFESYRVRSVPTWYLGGTANAAFRASIFNDPQIGLMDEALGPGMPSGVGEDTYLFYRVLKAGHKMLYQPHAYAWHRHRRDMAALKRQIYNYSKGHVAYHLTTLIRDHDLRSCVRLAIGLPLAHTWRIAQRLRLRSAYPLSLIMVEIAGNIAGPWGLWRSWRRVIRQGRSAPYSTPVREQVDIVELPRIEEYQETGITQ
ncbi:MAG: glycosyltransferase [Chloroflexota bacterium]